MTAKNIKRFFTAFVCAALVACTAVVCNAAGSKIQIEKLDNMTIQLPDNMLGITRDSKSTDKYFPFSDLIMTKQCLISRAVIFLCRLWIIRQPRRSRLL